jgi:hypothetical protein
VKVLKDIKWVFLGCKLGWFKTPVSSQTHKFIAATKFSDYLGLKHYKKAKKIKHFIHLRLAQGPQSFNTYHTISLYQLMDYMGLFQLI